MDVLLSAQGLLATTKMADSCSTGLFPLPPKGAAQAQLQSKILPQTKLRYMKYFT